MGPRKPGTGTPMRLLSFLVLPRAEELILDPMARLYASFIPRGAKLGSESLLLFEHVPLLNDSLWQTY